MESTNHEVTGDGKFLNKYLLENNPEVRLRMTEDFLLSGAGDRWLLVYSFVSNNIDEANASAAQHAAEVQAEVKAEHELGKSNKIIDLISKYQDNHIMRSAFLVAYKEQRGNESGLIEQLEAEINKADHTEWGEIGKAFDVQDDVELESCISWLKEMIINNRVIILSREEQPESQMNMSNSAFAISSFEDPQVLLITPDLVPFDVSEMDILLSLGHERGHVLHHDNRSLGSAEIGETELILKEFYSICEEWRLYQLMSDSQKVKVNENSTTYLYNPKLAKSKFRATMPNSNVNVNVDLDLETYLLMRAYVHSLQQSLGARKFLLEKAVSMSDDKEAARIRYAELLKVTEHPPVLSKEEINWLVN